MEKPIEGPAEEFRQLLNQRAKGFDTLTRRIFGMMNIALSGVVEYLASKKEHFEGSKFEWTKISFVPETDMVFFAGKQKHDIGTKISLENGDVVEITDDLAAYFNRTFEVGLPVKIAVTNNKDDVVKYLHDSADKYEGKLKNLIDSLKNKTTADIKEQDFNLDLLTDNQKKCLVQTVKGKKLN